MAEIQEVKISDIISDQAIQSRARIDQEAVADYALHLDDLPPILLFNDEGKLYLTEGFHRIAAHVLSKKAKIKAEIRKGTRDDAILHSAGANSTNGVHRSADDKRRAVNMILSNPEWAKKSARMIAQIAKVSHELVNRIIEENNPSGRASAVGKDGKTRKAKTKTKQAKSSKPVEKEAPAEPVRESADRAGKIIKRSETQLIFGQAELFSAAKSAAQALKKQIGELADLKVGAFIDRQALDDAIQSIYNVIESARPYTECPYCEGNPKPSCKVCRKTGFVSKQTWDTAIPIEIKEGAAATAEDKEQAKKSAEPKTEPKKEEPALDDTAKLKWKLNGKGAEKEFTEKTAAGLNKRFIDRNDKSRWVKSE
jgi:hypothetical protein